MIANGEFVLGSQLYHLCSRVLALAFATIDNVDTAIGIAVLSASLLREFILVGTQPASVVGDIYNWYVERLQALRRAHPEDTAGTRRLRMRFSEFF